MEGRTWYLTTDSREAVPISDVDDIMTCVHEVKDGVSEFFVLEREPESDSEYIQASVWTKGIVLSKSYVAEVRLPSSDGFRQWRLRTKDFDLINDMVTAYIEGNDPTAVGKWEDVTDEFE